MKDIDPTTETARPASAEAASRTRAVVLLPQPKASRQRPAGLRSDEARLAEAVGLAEAIALDVVAAWVVPVATIRPGTLFGSGKVEEIAGVLRAHDAGLVIIDHALSPIQQRNLERAWNAKVLDRTALILEIFGERAHTREGALQVELAHLNWQKSRLVRSWTHLERQRGGFGFLGGPGETQIEADRRQIQARIERLERDLDDVRRTRGLHRERRRRTGHPTVALVGYTNAGKSTLFNRLSSSDVEARDLLFATLDPTVRRIALPGGETVLISDTVGFISELPTHLVAAFRATLEAVGEADLILHVRDIAHPDTAAQARDVRDTLASIGIDAEAAGRVVEVHNKIDLIPPAQRPLSVKAGDSDSVAVSAVTGEGIDRLLAMIEARLFGARTEVVLSLPSGEGELLAWLYRNAEVLDRHDHDDRVDLKVRLPDAARDRILARCTPYLDTAAAVD